MRRATVSAAFLILAVLLGAVALWILPTVLVQHSADMSAVDRAKAVNDVRAPVITFLVAIGAAGTLIYTGRTYALSREGQVTDRYTKAVGQLGNESSAVRIGGIYALERIAEDSAKDRRTIIDVLGAFVRERSVLTRERQSDAPEDVMASLKVAERLLTNSPDSKLDLRGADLRNIDLRGIPESKANLDGAQLEGALLPGSTST